MFLLGAVAAGVVAGRATRGAKEATGNETGAGAGSGIGGYDTPLYDDPRSTPGGTATGAPLAGTDHPTRGPGYPTPGPVSPEGATTYSSDTEVGTEAWVDDPTRRGPL